MLLKSLLDSGSSLTDSSQKGIMQTLGSLALFLSSYTHLFNTLIECLPYTYIVLKVGQSTGVSALASFLPKKSQG